MVGNGGTPPLSRPGRGDRGRVPPRRPARPPSSPRNTPMSDLPEGLPDPIALLTERARESEAHTQQRAARDAELTRFHEDHQVVRKRVENALNRARPDESDLWRIK